MKEKSHSAAIFIADLLFIYASFLSVHIHYSGFVSTSLMADILMVCIALGWFFIHHNLSVAYLDIESGLFAILRNILLGYSLLSAGIIFAVSVFGNFAPNNKLILWSLLFSFLLSSGLRSFYFMIAKHLVRSGYQQKHILLIGGGIVAEKTMNQILSMRDSGYRLFGTLADDYHDSLPGGFYLGGLERFSEIVRSGNADEVIIALPLREEKVIREMVDKCEQEGIRVRIVPDFFRIIRNRAVLENIGDIPLVAIRTEPLSALRNRVLKRTFDIIFSLTVFILFSPVFLLLAIIIKITSPGPVLFKQKRICINNKEFEMYKFRTMFVQDKKDSDSKHTSPNDPRISKIGKLLRKTSMDELPQFMNVLIGDMSVVGPRPELVYFVEQFRKEIPHYKVRHLVKSGITGLAQVNGWRGDTSIEKRVECDIHYLENWSFWLDMKIIWLTVFGRKAHKNAY
ncbi:undecaprenyl-phosphate glucose phosphotransferase [Desulfobacterales bacterium HSG2]|nr:undecaprenyl-phosphate glucose phosphotransferase [Desulfobacterales bacterium HSG2]